MPQTSFTAYVRTSDGWTAPVTITRKHVRNLNLRVHADGAVTLSIPWRTSDATAQEFLNRKASWIRDRTDRRTTQTEEALVPITGPDAGTLPLWGELIDAAEVIGLDSPTVAPSTFARLINGNALTPGREASSIQALAALSPEELQARIDALYRREIAAVLPAAVTRVEAATGTHATRWSVRRMKTRWGSCTPKTGAIRINSALAAYPPECLDYVVAHELTHLLEPSHNARFHALLDRFCPKNREIAAILKRPAREVARASKDLATDI